MWRLLLTIYSALFSLGGILYLPLAAARRLVAGKKSVIGPRLRAARIELESPPGPGERIWIHAVSVGEVNAVRPLVGRLLERGHEVVVSTTTETGQNQARQVFGERAGVFYFPLDLGFVCRRFLEKVSPALILLAETEIWPNFIAAASRKKIPILLANGRISDRSFQNYSRLRFFFRPLFDRIAHFCMQSKLDRERMVELTGRPEKVNWVGNLKFDYELPPSPEKERLKRKVSNRLKRNESSLLWLCGSTKPGEEEILLTLFSQMRERFSELGLLVAPRHPHRAAEIKALAEKRAFSTLLLTAMTPGAGAAPAPVDVLIVDTIGDLAHLYEIADLVFIGGSLVPTGGQNVIEAAAFAKPILFGPHMENFREIAGAFVDSYAALQVGSPQELRMRIEDLLADSHARLWLGRNARKVIRDNQGAVGRTVEIVERHLDNGL